MAKDGYIGLRIAEETKERWVDAADENPEYRSLTHLICVAVRQELNDGAGGGEVADVDALHGVVAGEVGENENDMWCDVRWTDDEVRDSEILKDRKLTVEDGEKMLASYYWGMDNVGGAPVHRGVARVVESLEVVSDE